MKKLYIVAAIFLLVAAPAGAAPIPLGTLTPGFYDQQDSPCFIGYSCGPNLSVDTTIWSGSVPAEGNEFSPLYTGDQLALLKSLAGNTPMIAIDINQSGKLGSDDSQYLLRYVKVYFNGNSDSNNPDYQFGLNDVAVPQLETGNGDSDYVIMGLDLTNATESLKFEVAWGNLNGSIGDNNDGKELFFLVRSGTPQVPEPISLIFLGTGLLALRGLSRKVWSNRK